MIIIVKNEAPFQVLTHAFTIGPSPTGYELQVGATPDSFTSLFSVGANTPRMVTNVANGSYYRLKNNVGDVKVNWVRSCNDGGSGSGSTYTSGEYISIDQDVISVTGITPDAYLTTADTQNFATQAYVSGATTPIQEQLDDVERVTAIALDDLRDSVDECAKSSGLTELSASTSTALAGKADKQNVTARASSTTNPYLPGWNSQGVITGASQVYSVGMSINGSNRNGLLRGSNTNLPGFYAPTTVGTAGQPLLSNGSGAPVWGGYKFAFITQTAYDALATKDATTIYFVTGD